MAKTIYQDGDGNPDNNYTDPMMMTSTEPLDYVLVGLYNQRVTMRQ